MLIVSKPLRAYPEDRHPPHTLAPARVMVRPRASSGKGHDPVAHRIHKMLAKLQQTRCPAETARTARVAELAELLKNVALQEIEWINSDDRDGCADSKTPDPVAVAAAEELLVSQSVQGQQSSTS